MAEWHRGFPTKRGMYLVETTDAAHCITPWSDGTDYSETEGEYRPKGWICLSDWSGRVVRWVAMEDILLALNPILSSDGPDKDDGAQNA